MGSPSGLKPQDVVILLKMAASQGRSWRLVDLARERQIASEELTRRLHAA